MPVLTSAHSPIGGAGCLAALGTGVWWGRVRIRRMYR